MAARDPPIDADGVIDRMREVAGVATDIALGELLLHGSSAVSTWRRRGTVPYADCVNLAMRKGVSLDWMLLGVGQKFAPAVAGVAEPEPPAYGDPRVARMVRFIQAWQAGHEPDEVAWLERTLARAVPEYAEWLAAQTTRGETS